MGNVRVFMTLLTLRCAASVEKLETLPFPLQRLNLHRKFNQQQHKQIQQLQLPESFDLKGRNGDALLGWLLSSFISFPSTFTPFLTVFPPSLPNVTTSCKADLLQLLSTDQQKLIQMIDAVGKPPAGVTQGGINWMGNFDQCLGIGMKHCMMPWSAKGMNKLQEFRCIILVKYLLHNRVLAFLSGLRQ